LSRVKQALHSNHSLDDKHINVSMQGGKVILRGFVTSQRDLEAAVRVAKQAVGEGKVVNELTIKQPAESNGSG
jgi:osmotically-inducible protein OsmY